MAPNVSLRTATKDDSSMIWKFLMDHFFHDEPTMKSSKMVEYDSWSFKYMYQDFLKDYMVTKPLSQPYSIVAVDEDSGNVLGEFDIDFKLKCHNHTLIKKNVME